MVAVRVTEIYDLSTQVDKVGMVAIHTPSVGGLQKYWQGLIDQYKYLRVARCDVHVACASTLAADPLQVGTEEGEIAPQDLFNPILYKAVSNDSFNRVLNRMYGLSALAPLSSVDAGDVNNSIVDQFSLYYGLLGDVDGWKKAMPQSGFSMNGLYPMVYQVVNTFGNQYRLTNTYNDDLKNVPVVSDQDGIDYAQSPAVNFRGPAMRMPRIPTKAINATGSGYVSLANVGIPKTYVACFIVPPAKLHKFYYRMRVTWTFEFEELRPLTDCETMDGIRAAGFNTYGSDYVEQSKNMDVTTDAVDGAGVFIDKVMAAGK